jgi:dihydrofolate reductase
MGKLILEMQVSLDGFMAGAQGQTDWMIWNWGPDWTWDRNLRDFHTKLTLSAGHFLISRQMAEEGFVRHWQQAAAQKNEQTTFARHVCETPKTVISTTLTKERDIPGGWDNTDIAKDLISTVKNLKKLTTGNILVYGGATLVSSLLVHQLIDELYLLVNPVAIGHGMSIFGDLKKPMGFRLKAATIYLSGITVLHYAVPVS